MDVSLYMFNGFSFGVERVKEVPMWIGVAKQDGKVMAELFNGVTITFGFMRLYLGDNDLYEVGTDEEGAS